MKNHYVYYSYEEFGRGYIGSRSCACLPEEDTKYFGSFTDKTFAPKNKIVLAVFSTREEAIRAEIALHGAYDVVANPEFANKAKQTTEKFDRTGARSTAEHCQKISKANRGKRRTTEVIRKRQETRGEYPAGEDHHMYGKTHTEEVKNLIRIKRATQTNIPGKGVDWWEHEDGSLRRCELCPGEGWMLQKDRTGLRRQANKQPNRRYVNEQGVTKRSKKHPGEGWQNGSKWVPPG